ncbi:ABC-three component system protein [Chondromyces crocatus]|uniref:Uncharacterized protein n=1 Tax=Chondromyces crocatus TaxID=52 RepID=A0A0K1E8Q6_CHOCO|nr:ABC-three component system protein [Chondromyces crocatus]AKT37245.1 uncharacterized protein CMC5_013760 [Chondromyces crocatus]
MIGRIESSLPTFKPLRFGPGLNVLLTQKSPGATERQTRNGAGKTSFVELVHFLLGSNADPRHFLRAEKALETATFSMAFDLSGARVEVERSASRPNEFVIAQGDPSQWPCKPKLDKKTGHLTLRREDWNANLGCLMFGLPAPAGQEERRFGPTFRSLFSYFARRQGSGGFLRPEQHAEKQSPWDQQVAVTFLLGLDPAIPQELQEVRQREKALTEFRRAAREGAFGELIEKAADLRTKVTVSEARAARLREQLATFHVVPQYREHEQEASRITVRLAELANDNQADRQLVLQLREAVTAEAPPRFAEVKQAYEEAGVVLPGLVVKRFEDVERFHRSIVENRRSHLRAEIDAAEERIRARDHEKQGLDERRAQIMGLLESGGALEHFSQLQAEVARIESNTESLRRRYEAADTLERKGAELEVERARLHQRLQDDHHEQRDVIDEAVLTFENLSTALYEKAGSLTVEATVNGPVFEIKIEASRSKGINNMQIFCFDMMLMELWAKRGRGPGVLIHDSHLFDGVDERQVAHALEIGAERAKLHGFQYIVTMNEDAVPRAALPSSFDFDRHVLDVRLTDASEGGGLFGFRFD